MSDVLRNKRILITGAAAGIGLGVARACANAGASLVVSDINYDGLLKSTASLTEDPDKLYAVKLDVSDSSSIDACFADLTDRFEKIDGVVNNAGITIQSPFLEFEETDIERLWSNNLRSVFLMCQRAARIMKQTGGGSIVNVASVHAGASVPGFEMYAATKGGIVSMTKAMSWSLGPHEIRVNSLSPGLTATEEIQELADSRPDLAKTFALMHATGRFATVDEVGQTAVFLLSDNASAVTGADITVDHGEVALLVRAEDLV
jgi:NAD(P)-dependent dehydrogenase (short-subunit alcohol dehydrogenase family)